MQTVTELWIRTISTIVISVLIMGGCFVYFIYSFYRSKYRIQELVFLEERILKRDEWSRKIVWEKNIVENKLVEDAKRISKEREEKVDKLWNNRDKIPQLDMNRIALLHLLLSGSKEAITPDVLENEVEKVKKSYEIIKDYVK